jgi:hypothetical protein
VHDASVPNTEAVALGLQRTGRIITAAALLFCVAIGAFATSQIIFIKELGIGIAALGAVADGAAGPVDLVGAETAAVAVRPGGPLGDIAKPRLTHQTGLAVW